MIKNANLQLFRYNLIQNSSGTKLEYLIIIYENQVDP